MKLAVQSSKALVKWRKHVAEWKEFLKVLEGDRRAAVLQVNTGTQAQRPTYEA